MSPERWCGCVGYTFVASRKGKRQLLVDGHLFGCKEQRGERTYWTCTEYYRSGCPGRCVTFRGSLKLTGGLHNHGPQWPGVGPVGPAPQTLPPSPLHPTTLTTTAVFASSSGPTPGAAAAGLGVPEGLEAAAGI